MSNDHNSPELTEGTNKTDSVPFGPRQPPWTVTVSGMIENAYPWFIGFAVFAVLAFGLSSFKLWSLLAFFIFVFWLIFGHLVVCIQICKWETQIGQAGKAVLLLVASSFIPSVRIGCEWLDYATSGFRGEPFPANSVNPEIWQLAGFYFVAFLIPSVVVGYLLPIREDF